MIFLLIISCGVPVIPTECRQCVAQRRSITKNIKGAVMSSFPTWHYDELIQIGTDYASVEEVRIYDERMNKLRNIKAETDDIGNALNLTKNHSILEIGAGTGECALELSKRCGWVTAVDVSPAMIDYARTKAGLRGRDNITFQHGGFLTFDFNGPALDAVVSQLALHHLPDFWKFIALQRIFSALKPGGGLYLRDIVYPSNTDHCGTFFNNVIDEFTNSAGERLAGQIASHIKKEFSTLDWIMEGIIKRAGFTLRKAEYYDGIFATYVCVKQVPSDRG